MTMNVLANVTQGFSGKKTKQEPSNEHQNKADKIYSGLSFIYIKQVTRVRGTRISFKLNYMLGWGTETGLLELELSIRIAES